MVETSARNRVGAFLQVILLISLSFNIISYMSRTRQSRFFSKVQDFFLKDRSNVHAVKRHHFFRHPEEGASRPGFITSAPQSNRPGFIAGLGVVAPPADVGAEILAETKDKGSKLLLMLIAVGLLLYIKSRAF
jgi:hypothetical protein